MQLVQDLVHKLEVGAGARALRVGLGILAVIGVTVLYHTIGKSVPFSRDAMDAAQLGRNLAEGRGYSTFYIRPLSMHLISRRQAIPAGLGAPSSADSYRLKQPHPDLANPPVYPVVLAGLQYLMKLGPAPKITASSWTPDSWIIWFNQLLFFALIGMVFVLARKLFDSRVAWLSAALLFTADALWKFVFSGLSTMLLLVEFTTLIWVLVRLEKEAREAARLRPLILLAIAAGVLTGLGGLTRYSFAWMIVPVTIFLALCGGSRRVIVAPLAAGSFLLILVPWLVRNYSVSGTLFGTAGFAVYDLQSPEMETMLTPDLRNQGLRFFTFKFLLLLRQALGSGLPLIGIAWLSAFFIVSLLVAFPDPASRRLRYFLVGSMAVLTFVQALAFSPAADESETSSNNLLVLLLPLVVVYGASFFFVVMDQMETPLRELRYIAMAALLVLAASPMLLGFPIGYLHPLAHRGTSNPASMRELNAWVREGELTMSDVPWAVAWYARRPCIEVSTGGASDFVEINDYHQPIQELYFLHGVSASWPSFGANIGRARAMRRPGTDEDRPFTVPANIPMGPEKPSQALTDDRLKEEAVFPLHCFQYRSNFAPGELLLTARENSDR